MQKALTKPGFEFIFSISLLAIFILPLLVFAQNTKDVGIKITNSDTLINGKNINDLSAPEQKQALKDIKVLGNVTSLQKMDHRRTVIRKKGMADTGADRVVIEKRSFNNDKAQPFRVPNDSTTRVFKFHIKHPRLHDSTFAFNYRLNHTNDDRFDGRERDFNFPSRRPRMGFMHHRNVQSFDYTNTGSDGFSTHVSFRVTDPSPEKLKEITGDEKAELEIKDLNLVPEFSSGKIALMFSMPAYTAADVKLMDNDGKLIWREKAMNSSFSKSFAMGLNGIYYLEVKQGGKVALKRIIKEE